MGKLSFFHFQVTEWKLKNENVCNPNGPHMVLLCWDECKVELFVWNG